MRKVRDWVREMWRPILIGLAVASVVGFIFGFHLGSLPGGASTPEREYIASVHSGKDLLKNPVYLPHKLPVYILFKLHVQRLAAYRAISAVIASFTVLAFFFVLREWYTIRTAILGTWLLFTSAWVLHIGRLATPEAAFFLTLPLIWAGTWLYFTTLRKTALLSLCLGVGAIVYIPGFIWLLVITGVWHRKHIWHEIKEIPRWYQIASVTIIFLILLPLIWASIQSGQVLLAVTGLPDHLPGLKELIHNARDAVSALAFHGPNDPVRWLGQIPLLDVFSLVMLALGLYTFRYHFKQVKAKILVQALVLLSILIVLGGEVTVTALLPICYLFVAGGIAFMLQQWFTVFPRNPIARTIATTLISVSVLFVSYYHINHYFIAWPQTPAVRQAFTPQPFGQN